MPERLCTVLLFLAGDRAERYVAQLLAETTAIYRAQRNRDDIERWLRRHGLQRFSGDGVSRR